MSNICKCRNGSITECDLDQMAVCISIQGKCRGSCKNIPKNLTETELYNWLINEFTGQNRSLNQRLSAEERRNLSQGRYKFVDDFGRTNIVNFTLPGNKNKDGLDFR